MAKKGNPKALNDSGARPVWSTEAGDLRRSHPAATRPAAPGGGGGQGIRLRLDRRASGRLVTVVTGLHGSAAEVEALARQLKAACGTGGTVKDGALELQGDHRSAVETALAARGLKSKRAGG
jgi:translation initiation factor 1